MKHTSLLLSVLALFACGTRVVDLTGPRDAGPKQDARPDQNVGTGSAATGECEMLTRRDGTECRICYAPDGAVVEGSCVPLAPPVSAPPPQQIDPATATCIAFPMTADSRCLECYAPAGKYTVCLKCKDSIKTGAAGEVCRSCFWGDSTDQCLQCFAPDGTTTHDDCDTSRKESFPKMVVPPPK